MDYRWLLALAVSLVLAAPAGAQCHEQHDRLALDADPFTAREPIAPLLEGLGENHFPVTTSSERAQAFVDQGLKLTYGFNHEEALRSFKEAARLDPGCAMAYWGWALVLGPNLNLPMKPEVVPQARRAIELALERKDGVTERERGYIEALARRYSADPGAERAPLDLAFADAMRELYRKFPDDNDAGVLFAAALMERSPWNYWTPDDRPRQDTPEILAVLGQVLARDARHEGALHYYIHAVEAVDARRGEAAADVLATLAPGAGHLVHMPSHIWIQLGRYREAYEANVRAADSDERYIAQCRAQGIYPLTYYPHNVHFQSWAAMLSGRGAAALDAARKAAAGVPEDMHGDEWALFQTLHALPLVTLVRFGRWDAVLAEPRPRADRVYETGVWHFARGLALLRRGQPEPAGAELAALTALASAPEAAGTPLGYAGAANLLAIAREILAGEAAAATGRHEAAIAHLDRAVRLEDALAYNEPPDWYLPARHALGAVLLEAGRPREAEVVYWQDLRRHQDNGFALTGLRESLRAQGRLDEVQEIERRLRAAWPDADVQLTGSRY